MSSEADTVRRILHLDMDAFYASVEQLDNPELRGQPVMIGQDPRGIVSTCSYEARKYGVRSAMPVVQARRLCPHGIFLPGRMRRYAEVSRLVMGVLHDISPVVEQASVDEAYLDVTGMEKLFGPPLAVAELVREKVRAASGLSCSVGIAPVRFLAKIASDFRKPGGVTILESQDVAAFLAVLPVAKIPGVGPRTLPKLESLGVRTCGDVLRYSREFWEGQLGEWGLVLLARAQGQGSSELTPSSQAKSSSAENTFPQDLSDLVEMRRWLLKQAERVGRDLRRHGLIGRTVTLKVKFSDFKQITRSLTLAEPTDADQAIFSAACGLLDKVSLVKKVRLLGVGVSNFVDGPLQLNLLSDNQSERLRRLDRAVDAIRDKHGREAVKRGRLFKNREGDRP